MGFKRRLKKNKEKQQGKTVDAADVLAQQEAEAREASDEFETEVYIPSGWDVTEEERYVYAFHNSQAPKLKKNQISIYSMELLEQGDGGAVITALVRNSVSQPIKFEDPTILLLGPDKEVIARKKFDLSVLGDISAFKAVPWKFSFDAEDLEPGAKLPSDDWMLAFELKAEHSLDLDKTWEESIAEDTREALEKIVADAPKLKPGELNFMGLEAQVKDSGDLVVTFLIRNGTDKNVNIEQLPMGLKDATDEEVARGVFKLEDFTVKANTSKPWSFIFPESMVSKKDPDLSRWNLYALQ
ncbi:accessory Sec system S-layer assembly protein [Aciduricibacillus chroicocephali]|uniref:Accessory Sec system S-layer assembly protein n=1 Tax=Aciduricibacillus chroicocephali TaxID=3054939 RepID=A0ABY9KU42_9BACI|nr:accessory Sec system S-layer assembly protein [Bacillaceae bacterium 44XB]